MQDGEVEPQRPPHTNAEGLGLLVSSGERTWGQAI